MSSSISLEKNHAHKAFSELNEPVVKAGGALKAYFIVAASVSSVAALVMGAITVGGIGFTIFAACSGFGLPLVICGVATTVFAAMSTASFIAATGYSISGLTAA